MQQDTCETTRATSTYVREANLTDDQPILTALAQAYLRPDADDTRFQWLYRENPFGPARAWIACDKQDQAIGISALFPRPMYCDGTVVPACVLGDLCVSPEHRSVGPALQLQRACLRSAQSSDFSLAYDFPSKTMLAIYKHLGIESLEKSVRVAKILRAEAIFHNRKAPSISRPFVAAANSVLAFGDRFSQGPAGIEFSLQDGLCTPEYSELATEVGSSVGTCTVRSAEYLNWRYRQHPHVQYEFLTARRGQKLLAYCVFSRSSDMATVAELFGKADDQVMAGLLRRVAAWLRTRGVARLSVPVLSNDPRIKLLRKLGFWEREAVPVIVLGHKQGSSSQMLLTHGDRES